VTCTSATVNGGGGTGVCGGAVTLSTASTQIASGFEGSGTRNYAVNLGFTLADSWKYVAKISPLCTLTLTYTVTAP
jgi:hypothetical protein